MSDISEARDEKGRFKEGNPGGPGRRPLSVVSVLKKKLHEIPDGDTRERIEILVDEYLSEIQAKKDGVAIRDLIDRFDGRPRQDIDVSGKIELPRVIGFYPEDYAKDGTAPEDPGVNQEPGQV